MDHVIYNRNSLRDNPTVLQVFVFDVQTMNQMHEKINSQDKKIKWQVMNCNLKDKLFSYTRPLLNVHISSE